ncbi:tRNA lysidine(34) synthetase TilS [Sporosarcina gallistercoris]|uniref:tRNA(Ile)-lysidine synthase n=1 Tax=Sporosarcina gallistercoris TaxID=2762245 RepID=A0ABR8PMU5_9BACL|nr:tRNA lysidine(34) synthetase TilS [Sporosarcina gallistercoris]MBD7909506.1 tRNA lysidine(34) synthetase TilS [Sporosarcina gallistercoris]
MAEVTQVKDNLFNKVPAFIRQERLLHNDDRVLIACSGGVDSVVLLHFLSEQRERLDIEIGAIHVDHCLRGEESATDGKVVQKLCERLGVPFYGTTLPVPDLLKAQGGNLQEVCRTGRYSLFEETMQSGGFTVLAVAHHAEDQLETILMQLAKGQRPRGMPVSRRFGEGRLVRPFLSLIKSDLYEYAELHKLPFREDPSNEKDDYTRNRYRHHIVPVLLDENPAAAENSVRMAAALQEDNMLLESLAKEHLERLLTFTDKGIPVIHSAEFQTVHPALQKRVVPLLLKYLYNGETIPAIYNSDLLNQLIRQLSADTGSASINLPDRWLLQRDYGVSTFVRKEEGPLDRVIPFPPNEWVQWGQWKLCWCKSSAVEPSALDDVTDWRYFPSEERALPSVIRSRRTGDRIQIHGMEHPKRVSRVLIDEKVKQSVRDTLPVIVSEKGDICAIPGVRYSESFTKKPSAEQAYILMMVWPK